MTLERIKKIRQSFINALEELQNNQIKSEEEQSAKLESAKTGQPIELTGYGIVDAGGNDTGRRFIRKKDAEKFLDNQKNL